MVSVLSYVSDVEEFQSDIDTVDTITTGLGYSLTAAINFVKLPGNLETQLRGTANVLDLPAPVIAVLGVMPFGIGTAIKTLDRIADTAADVIDAQADIMRALDQAWAVPRTLFQTASTLNTVNQAAINAVDNVHEERAKEAQFLEASLGDQNIAAESQLIGKMDAYSADANMWFDQRDALLSPYTDAADLVSDAVNELAALMPDLSALTNILNSAEAIFLPFKQAAESLEDLLCVTIDLIIIQIDVCQVLTDIASFAGFIIDAVEDLIIGILNGLGIDLLGGLDDLLDLILSPLDPVFDIVASLQTLAQDAVDAVAGLTEVFSEPFDDIMDELEALAGGTSLFENRIEGDLGGFDIRNDTLNGTDEEDGIFGLGGDDLITGQGGRDFLFGGDGNDVITGSGHDEIYGGIGNDNLRGLHGFDIIDGGDGNDTLNGGGGADLMIGGAGDDVYFVDNLGDEIREKAVDGFDRINSSISLTIKGNIEELKLTGDGNTDATGNKNANTLIGNSGRNELSGLNEDDDLRGGSGKDVLYGGGGNDSADGGQGDDIVSGGDGFDLLMGSAGKDVLKGQSGHDTLFGGEGADTLYGNNGNDTLFGGGGADLLDGGKGADILFGEGNADLLIGGAGFDTLFGGEANDTLQAGNGNDTLYGGGGEDSLSGGKGADRLYGDGKADQIYGNSGSDTLFGGDGADLLYGQSGQDILKGGDQSDTLFGGEDADTLFGNMGNDVLTGDAGQDVLNGGGGHDNLAGGAGNDEFIFNNGKDVIYDFEDDIDTISIDAVVWGGGAKTTAEILEHATITSDGAHFVFDSGNELTVRGVTDLSILANDLNML
ncbi:MAG: calcium-binding protein [Rhodobacteraceae bacterium]|nr:calcium-binding protein [Paracoccaceae bacterium]